MSLLVAMMVMSSRAANELMNNISATWATPMMTSRLRRGAGGRQQQKTDKMALLDDEQDQQRRFLGESVCSADGSRCGRTGCCRTEGFFCYVKNECSEVCLEEETCPSGWSCAIRTEPKPRPSSAGSSEPECSAEFARCDKSGCCAAPGELCYVKNECRAFCRPAGECPADWDCGEVSTPSPEPTHTPIGSEPCITFSAFFINFLAGKRRGPVVKTESLVKSGVLYRDADDIVTLTAVPSDACFSVLQKSVKLSLFSVDGQGNDIGEKIQSRVENAKPYTLYGDTSVGFRGSSTDLEIGRRYRIEAKAYSKKGAEGQLLGTDMVTFSVESFKPEPTSSPSPSPTSVPTSVPSFSQSIVPTGMASLPTSHPSTFPTAALTTAIPTEALAPTSLPSGAPSAGPISSPTTTPSLPPTIVPTISSSAAPTSAPSFSPKRTFAPSPVPTPQPTANPNPTVRPSLSWNPSAAPTPLVSATPPPSAAEATDAPAVAPTMFPTWEPTLVPTIEQLKIEPTPDNESMGTQAPTLGITEPSGSPLLSLAPTLSPSLFVFENELSSATVVALLFAEALNQTLS